MLRRTWPWVLLCVLLPKSSLPAETKPDSSYKVKESNYTVADIRKEFGLEFGEYAKSMLCSGCRLMASRWKAELANNPDVRSEEKSEAQEAAVQAFRGVCSNIPDPILGLFSPRGTLEFKAYKDVENKTLADEALKFSERARLMALRICNAIMSDFNKELVAELWPETGRGRSEWTRWLCAQRAKLCKLKELREDDDEDEDPADRTTDVRVGTNPTKAAAEEKSDRKEAEAMAKIRDKMGGKEKLNAMLQKTMDLEQRLESDDAGADQEAIMAELQGLLGESGLSGMMGADGLPKAGASAKVETNKQPAKKKTKKKKTKGVAQEL